MEGSQKVKNILKLDKDGRVVKRSILGHQNDFESAQLTEKNDQRRLASERAHSLDPIRGEKGNRYQNK